MKKLLATLLVAVMIMSCMSVVSFAAGTVYAVAEFPIPEMTSEGFDMASFGLKNPIGKEYMTNAVAAGAVAGSPILSALQQTMMGGMSGGAPAVMPTTATPSDLVLVPLYVSGESVGSFDVTLKYDSTYLTPVPGVGLGSNKVQSAGFYTNAGYDAAGAPNGYIGSLYFKVNADAVGDPEGLATTTVTWDFSNGYIRNLATEDIPTGNLTTTIALSGLQPGSTEAAKMEAADVAAMEASKLVYGGTDTFANFKNAYGLGVDVAADYTEDMSYVCAFGTVDTTKEADEYGFKLTTSYGKVIKGKAVNVVDGKFGIVFYGADYVLEGATIEAYAIVDGQEI